MGEKYGIWKIFSFFVKIHSLRQMWENRIIKGHRMVRAERPEDKQKARRTNIMLFTISMVFCVAWLPLNLIGILLDAEADLFGDNIQAMILTFIACHLVSMNAWWVCARAIYISASYSRSLSLLFWCLIKERWKMRRNVICETQLSYHCRKIQNYFTTLPQCSKFTQNLPK